MKHVILIDYNRNLGFVTIKLISQESITIQDTLLSLEYNNIKEFVSQVELLTEKKLEGNIYKDVAYEIYSICNYCNIERFLIEYNKVP